MSTIRMEASKLPLATKMLTQVQHARFVLVPVCRMSTTARLSGATLLSVAFAMDQQKGSVKCRGYICCCWWGAQAAVQEPEEAEREKTGSMFPTCLPLGKAASLVPETELSHFWLLFFSSSFLRYKYVLLNSALPSTHLGYMAVSLLS